MRVICLLFLAISLAGVLLATTSPATAETNVPVTDRCFLSESQNQVNVLILMDVSGSLASNDPDGARQKGLESALNNLARLARTHDDVDIKVAIDTFARRYRQVLGWLDANEAAVALADNIREIIRSGGRTDYREALKGAAARFSEEPESTCNLLMWFTDGSHDTNNSTQVVASEWADLTELCSSQEMSDLSNVSVWTTSVLLSSDDLNQASLNTTRTEPLEFVYGEHPRNCEHPLDGEIRADINSEELRNLLGELLSEAVYRSTATSDLPGDDDLLPNEAEFEKCQGEGTQDDPCQFNFGLTETHEGFRVFVDMTYSNNQILDPSAINVDLISPTDRTYSVYSASGSQPTNEVRYQEIGDSGFLSYFPYDSRWEIIGHQVARDSATDWEWAGEWTLHYWGDDSVQSREATKVASALRTITTPKPSVNMRVTPQDALFGEITNYPEPDQIPELRLRVENGQGGPLYTTRTFPLSPVSTENPQFSEPDIYKDLLYWDSEAGGGDGTSLLEAFENQPPITLVGELSQEFQYGNNDVTWTRPLDRQLELEGLANFIEGVNERAELEEWLNDLEQGNADQPALPTVQLTNTPYDINGSEVELDVDVPEGRFPGDLSLVDVRATEGNPAGAWNCSTPSDTPCPPVKVDLGLNEDGNVETTLVIEIRPNPDLERTLRNRYVMFSNDEWADIWNRISQATQATTLTLTSEPIQVDIATPSDKISKFLPILVALVLLAVALRFAAAWWLRPWLPLATAQYVVKPLQSATGLAPMISQQRELCMDLTARSSSANIGSVVLNSRLLPLLIGRPPLLEARSSRGNCFGSRGSYHNRKGERVGRVGNSLHDGWVVDLATDTPLLIVWDLPSDETDQANRISEVTSEASDKLEKLHLATHKPASNQSSKIPSPQTDPFSNPARDPFAEPRISNDPFADESRDPFNEPRRSDPFT